MSKFFFMVLFVFGGLFPALTRAEAPVLVFKNEVVIQVVSDYCPWGTPCTRPLKPGLYLFTGEYLADGLRNRTLSIHKEEVAKEQCARFKASTNVRCFPNYFVKKTDVNDPLLSEQWHHIFIESQYAWASVPITTDKTVAVLDTGISCGSHTDLSCIAGHNSHGTGLPVDRNGHGSHVAGLIGATIDNAIGVAGVANVKLMPIKVLGDSGGGSVYTVMQGFQWAVDNGADIINMSLGGGGHAPAFQEMIDEAHGKGVIIVAAAGNSNTNNDTTPHYPSNYNNVISVGALNSGGEKSSFSNYGESVNVWAPGSSILSTYIGNSFQRLSGTSMAAPIVTGSIALTDRIPEDGTLNLKRMLGAPLCEKDKCRKCYKNKKCSLKETKKKKRACRKRCRDKHHCKKGELRC